MKQITAFVRRYHREHRDEQTAKLKEQYSLTDDEAATMYERLVYDVVEAEVASGNLDPDK